MKDVPKLKARLSKAQTEAELLKAELTQKQHAYQSARELVKKFETALENLSKRKDITISDHARLRFLERVDHINLEVLESRILSPEVVKLIEQLGGTGVYPSYDFKVVLKNYTVVTIIAI